MEDFSDPLSGFMTINIKNRESALLNRRAGGNIPVKMIILISAESRAKRFGEVVESSNQ